MPIIDMDSHIQPPFTWMHSYLKRERPELAALIPETKTSDFVHLLAGALSGEMMSSLPANIGPRDPKEVIPELWWPLLDLFASKRTIEEVEEAIYHSDVPLGAGPITDLIDHYWRAPGGWDADQRIAYLDRSGIDVQFVDGVLAVVMADVAPDKAHQFINAANTANADLLSAHIDRLIPITIIDMDDIDWSLSEMTRMRGLGSRAVHIRATPIEGKSLAHPDFDRFWAAIVDLGMIGYLHAGTGHKVSIDPGWANHGGAFITTGILANVQYHQIPSIFFSALIAGGVFDRFPKLVVVSAELGGHAWLPDMLAAMDQFVDGKNSMLTGKFNYPLRPSEYARRNIRVSPLPGTNPVAPYLEQLDGMLVFSTDYPHAEGSPDAVKFYDQHLSGVNARLRNNFLGDSMAEVFSRMGDPLHALAMAAE
jgi:predicted TIM-barrel fold metal-dependent hydrolase